VKLHGCLYALGMLVMCAGSAHARVERFALIIGNNRGADGEVALRYAESDAVRVHDVLRELGGFSPLNTLLLRGQDASVVRSALITLNDRIRDAVSVPDTQAVLMVYFSGHADAHALHLRGSELPIGELRQLTRGSAANFRLVVLDACRSGALTRVKGGRRVPAFALPALEHEPLPGDGVAFLTASSATEDAQESDELQSSIFTHAFVSGLLGAADSDGDGAVVLDEVYRYAYQSTLRATSRTLAGSQHPTFAYDLRGRGRLVLTRVAENASERALLAFPANLGFLVMRGSATGPVALELEVDDESGASRTISLEPGRYFVRARAADVMYEGTIDAPSGSSRAIAVDELERIEYAQLVRKGARPSQLAHGPDVGMHVRSGLPTATGACVGGFVGYAVDLRSFGVRGRFSTCASQLENRLLRADVLVHAADVTLLHAWDVGRATFDLGLGGGLSLFDQRFDGRSRARDRLSAAPFIQVGGGAQLGLGAGLSAGLTLDAETHFLRVHDQAGAPERLTVAFAVRCSLAVAKRF
jgi:hypothetical protein